MWQRRLRSVSLGALRLAVASGMLSACRERAPEPLRTPTYDDPVAGILARRCLPCHASPNGDAAVVPPALGTYAESAYVAPAIALAVMRREMPPAGADASGLCGEWQESAWLEPQEITALDAWARAGAPRAPASAAALRANTTPTPSNAATASGTSSLQLPAFAPRVGADATRCFVVRVDNAHDTLATALRLHSVPPLALQQAQLYALDTPDAAAAAARFDAEDALPGFECYGSSRVPDARLVASWSWSDAAQKLPSDIGARLHAGQALVMRLRYNLLGLGFAAPPVSARAELILNDSAREARFLPLSALGFRLPAAERQTEAHAELTLRTALTLHGVVPSMHTLGRTLHLELARDGHRTCLAHFGHWNVYAQQLSLYKKPLELAAGTSVRMTCVYSTTSRQQEVPQGDGSEDEACEVGLWVTER